jgi:hypothetical protein
MENKSTFKTALIMIAVLYSTLLGQLKAQIANNYPNDLLIQNDPNVVFTEMFEQDSVSNLLIGYTNISNPTNISFSSSVPPGSNGTQSGKFTTYHTSNSVIATEIRKKFTNTISDSVFVRFYVKYNNTHTHHHSGIWLIGANPANSCFPCILTGSSTPFVSDSAFSLGAELTGSTINPQTNSRFALYNKWMGMHPLNSGLYYGNEFLHSNPIDIINTTQWNCIEVMLKVNNPTTDSTGEAKLWINGQLITHLGKGLPNGVWNQLNFTIGTGTPFNGFRWRSNPLVVFNSIWIKNYTYVSSDPNPNDILYDHIVVAKKYIGPISTNNTGVNDIDNQKDITLYPNPADDFINFSTMIKKLSIANIFGQVIFQSNDISNISTKSLIDGLYIIKADNRTYKLIVKH